MKSIISWWVIIFSIVYLLCGTTNAQTANAPVSQTNEAIFNRADRPFGICFEFDNDPMVSDYGICAAYNATNYLRLTGSVGYLNETIVTTTTSNGISTTSDSPGESGVALGFGVKALMPHWEFSPVIGLNFSETFVNLPPYEAFFYIPNGAGGGNYNLFLIYTNVGFDYQTKGGFNLGLVINIPLNNSDFNTYVFPGLYIGKFF